jgi:sec-independent protein translocase protein TatA
VFTGILQPTHLIIVVVIALIFLGPKRLPDAGRALGEGLKEFKDSIGGNHDDHLVSVRTEVTPEDQPR